MTTVVLARRFAAPIGVASPRLAPRRRPTPSATASAFRCYGFTSASLAEVGVAASARPFESRRVEDLFRRMAALNRDDLHTIAEIISDRLGLTFVEGVAENDAAEANGAGAGAAEEVVAEEKTTFDLKLVEFDTKAKIKVIKEVRAISGLGLKEAKELVEGAPKVVKKDIKKEEAEELQKKLEEVGATVEIS